MCRVRIRIPDQWYGDYLAMIGAARIGEQRLKEICAKYGSSLITDFVEEWLNYSEALAALAIGELENGTSTEIGYHDPTGFTDGPIPLTCTVTVDNKKRLVEVDLRNNIDCQPFGMNLSEATASGCAITGVLNILGGKIPVNSGTLRRIIVLLRENCVAGIPRHPASCSLATSNLACRLINLVQYTLSKDSKGFGVAEGGVAVGAGLSVISGYDRRSNREFIAQPYFGDNGGPASSEVDGILNYGAPVGAGVAYRDSIEIVEHRYPLLYHSMRIIADSGGAGYRRGGLAWLVEFGPRFDPVTVSFPLDGFLHPPLGVRGGQPGSLAVAQKILIDNSVTDLSHIVRETLIPGERLRGMMNGGGGFGNPFMREPELVLEDVVSKFVTIPSAEKFYGVIISNDESDHLTVNKAATIDARKAL